MARQTGNCSPPPYVVATAPAKWKFAGKALAVKALLVSPHPLLSYLAGVGFVMFVTAVVLKAVQGAIIGLALPPWLAFIAVGLAASPLGADWSSGLGQLPLQRSYLKVARRSPAVRLDSFWLCAAEVSWWVPVRVRQSRCCRSGPAGDTAQSAAVLDATGARSLMKSPWM